MKTIDTRELYTRLCELETLRDDAAEALEALHDPDTDETMDEKQAILDAANYMFGDDEQAELAALEVLRDEIGESTMRDGEAMIPTSNGGFEDYARELHADLHGNNHDWPYNCIDWEKAAEELSQDYTSVSYQGEDYFIRA